MEQNADLDIFLIATPGLEGPLCAEAQSNGFAQAKEVRGGVTCRGSWSEVWRANLTLRGANKVLVRLGNFPAVHLAQLDKRARKFPWKEFLRPDVPIKVEATSRKSRIYHAGAARQRIERAISETLGAPISSEASLRVLLRIEKDMCTLSIDSSGELLHKRGHKEAIAKAPMRETMAAMFLHDCGYTGNEPVLDPMCGSGTFVIEAAEIALGLLPGRSRSFAFEDLASFDRDHWKSMRDCITSKETGLTFCGSDRNAGAIEAATANAKRAQVSQATQFHLKSVSDMKPPEGPKGLVIVNPPYGARIGDEKRLRSVYGAMGKALMSRFQGWRVGIVTSSASLARSTRLPLLAPGPVVDHGGTKIRLYKTDPLG
ncbi:MULTISPECIES: class I SAM-dependent RNA methyltransferase [unclassified Ruegeria]|uniref:THUMP domain-containing class I SAM-dependent RNA methyltransferase n=1 Tax=unclassified Ruegeria TaxID=2625375 RepID=UPI0014884369|nr:MULTISPECIES: class I SAM-dependent RNA methyltransferase [unclassified Ruegeria]NOD76743.1 class I SAM-dependent RNA methyltransferase [Ruegeria sp. HKCCD4332]NOD88253.1 class I SAM-dependent RNA methyltransferase [Ruegeria sp. HKCCD4318]NOE13162.1 class I SAM-dependent RNA methyltransferase [Ruegeria sp. HKCCD4318-2]NOG11296.1 class I SAM-dependent RNA methyltransferase [Ruegeria sp. HKCCD4315]